MKLKESENYIETEDYQFIQEPEKNSLSACLSASFFIYLFIFLTRADYFGEGGGPLDV